jgi:hypothetical protein
VTLTLKETRAVSGLADILYDFLPGSGHKVWKGHVNFGTVANQVGVGDFWGGGSKKPAINTLLSQTLQHRGHLFQNLMVEIVRSGIAYREKQNQPITRAEIERVNGHILDLGFKFPELWDHEFLISLETTTEERARDQFAQADSQQKEISAHQRRSLLLRELKDWFFQLAAEVDRNKAGLTLEKLLNRLFDAFELQPRQPFRVIGEQIDGSFELDGETYLLESKWEKEPLREAHLLVFRGKIEGKSTFTRGVLIALNDITGEARDSITRGKAPSFFVMNGYDLMMILSESIGLTDFLRKRRRLLAEEGRVCVPFVEIQ